MSAHCDAHGKVRYNTRRQARHAAKVVGLTGGRLSVYPCTSWNGYHIGHLPAAVIAGNASRPRPTRNTR